MKRILVYLSVFLLCFIHLKAEENGLQWSEIATQIMKQQGAIDYCKNLNEGGHSDWRLPNIDELSTKLLKFCSKGISSECKVSEINKCLSAKDCAGSDQDDLEKYKCFCVEDMDLLSNNPDIRQNPTVGLPLYKLGFKPEDINNLMELFSPVKILGLENKENNLMKILSSAEIKLEKFGITHDFLQKAKANSEFIYQRAFIALFISSSLGEEGWGIFSDGIIPLSGGLVQCVRGKNLCENNNSCEKIKNSTGVCIKAAINDFSCECKQGFFWNGKECVNPCSTNICQSVSHSTSSCIPISATEYSCECEKGFSWNGKECVNPCSTNICQSVSHSTSSCIPISATEYSCECEKGFSWNGKNCTSALLGNICTGLTKCYNNEKEIPCPKSSKNEFFGQDAQYAKKKKCKPQSFQIKTISNQNVVIDKDTGLMWQQTIPKEKYKWEDAVNYCENLTYAGYSDWRLPTPQELLTIVNNMTIVDKNKDTVIDTTYFPDTPSDNFWSSSKSYLSSFALIVNFQYGGVRDDLDTRTHYVRCVR